MALSDIVTDVHAQLVIIDAGVATAQPAAKLGAVYLPELAAPPRVVWVPLRGAPGREGMAARGIGPRSLGERIVLAAAHIWGADPGAAEALLVNVHNACRRSMGGGYQWTSEDWPQQDGGEIAECGTLVVVVFQFRVPITEAGQQSQTVATQTMTSQIAFPGSTVSGSPAP